MKQKTTPPPEPAVSASASRPLWKWLAVGLAAVWLLGFFAFFFTRTLPNAQSLPDGSRLTRMYVWPEVGTLLLDKFLAVSDPNGPAQGFQYLPQRAGFLLVAGVVYLLAYLFGTGILHALRGNIKVFGRMEWHTLAVAVGLSALSLVTLLLGVVGLLQRWVFLLVYGLIVLFWAWQHARACGGLAAWKERTLSWGWLKWQEWQRGEGPWATPPLWITLGVLAPFMLLILLGAMLPSTDFDVKEYHFGGPKEYYLAGSVHFLPHNVYTSFPFLTEMLTLTGMVLYGDWYWGALAGKAILCGFAPLTALLIGLLVRRWLGTTAGLLAAVVHLSIPWTYRISVIAYTEGGLSLFLAASMLTAAIIAAQLQRKKTAFPSLFVCGFLAGSAASCKYPGLISVTIPIALFAGGAYLRAVRLGMRSYPQFWKAAATFLIGILLSFGPWLAKNLVETGNPVYPLLYSVFGGVEWDDAMNEKWKRAHSPDHHQLSDLWFSFVDVTSINDWQSPLILGYGLIGFLAYARNYVAIRWVAGYLVWLFVTWWVLTHRIDRFWVPMLPAASCLAACGAEWLRRTCWPLLLASLAPVLIFNLAFITTNLAGYNAHFVDLNQARLLTARITSPEVLFLNEYMQDLPGSVLCVGEAELFDATFPYRYNTVFDRSLFAEWTGVVDREIPEGDWELREPDVIRQVFREQNITEILVNWQEILRYRTTYGYTDYVTPSRFEALRELDLIGPPLTGTPFFQDATTLSPTQRAEVARWAPELIVTIDGREYFITAQIFPVL